MGSSHGGGAEEDERRTTRTRTAAAAAAAGTEDGEIYRETRRDSFGAHANSQPSVRHTPTAKHHSDGSAASQTEISCEGVARRRISIGFTKNIRPYTLNTLASLHLVSLCPKKMCVCQTNVRHGSAF